MKRSWLIGAALVLSLSAAACGGDDSDGTSSVTDSGTKPDGSVSHLVDGGLDGSIDSGVTPTEDGGSDAEVDSGL